MAKRAIKGRVKGWISAWSLMRLVRLLLGAIIFIQGLMASEMVTVVLGAAFGGMALLNIGCNGACPINTIGSGNKQNEPDFEEVVIRK